MTDVEVKSGCHCVNFGHDLTRYRWMINCHIASALLWLIRFICSCTDLSAASKSNVESQTDLNTFLAFIFLCELFGELPIILANIGYKCAIYVGRILYETDNDDIPNCPRKSVLRWSTFTCFTCDCYYENPYAVLLTRIIILGVFFTLRLIAFILGAACANRFPPRAIAYTVFAGLSLPLSVFIVVLEVLHNRRLWNYFPDGGSQMNRCPKHLEFFPYSIINDQRTSSWRSSLCAYSREKCPSRNLYHILLYHSSNTQYREDETLMIGFHQTDHKSAFQISREGFTPSPGGMLGPGVYFATCLSHTEFKANRRGAYICARVNVGRINRTQSRKDPGGDHDTIYYEHRLGSDEFCVRRTAQIVDWIIVVNQDDRRGLPAPAVPTEICDRFYGEVYQGCIY